MINKLGLKNIKALERQEEKLTKESILKNLKTIRNIKWNDSNSLKEIHKLVFIDIFKWSGRYRTLNISKTGTCFENFISISSEISRLLKEEIGNEVELISLYLKLNKVHPFREGNGRSTRLWLLIASEQLFGMTVDFSKIKSSEYMKAMQESSWNPRAAYLLLSKVFVKYTEKNYMSIFMRSIDASYAYENMSEFKIGKEKQLF